MTAVLDDLDLAAPSFSSMPPRDGSLVRAVEGVAEKLGRSLDPAQRHAVDVLTSAWSDGRPASLEAAVLCPRQNLKTYCLELITLVRMLRPGGDRLAVWSAHEVSTAQETFKTFLDLADTVPWFGQQVEHVSRATGREAITFKGGRRLKFKARIKTGGRGLAGDLVILDEAFALQPEHMGSLMPILSTKAKGQIFYGSSAPHARSDILHRVLKRGRAGGMAYVEWSAPGSLSEPGCSSLSCTHEPGMVVGDVYTPALVGCVMDDESMWLRANPAATVGRISLTYLRSERAALTPVEFARERLGWAEAQAAAANPAIPAPAWRAARDPESAPAGAVAFGVEVSLDRRTTTIGAFGMRTDGWWHGEIVEQLPGTGSAVDRLFDLSRRWAAPVGIDPASPAASLIDPLRERGVQVVTPTSRVLAATCGQVFDDVTASPPRQYHRGQPVLDDAVSAAGQKVVGDGFRWDRRGEGDIAPLYAVTLARCAHQESPPGMPGVFDL